MQPTSFPLRLVCIAAPFLSLFPAGAAAADDAPLAFSGEVALTSDYVYRGQSFSDGAPAIQGSLHWSNADATTLPGLSADAWASSIDFGGGDPTDAELSATLGYTFALPHAAIDLGVSYIVYPGAPEGGRYDYAELSGAVTAPISSGDVTASLHYSPRYSGDTGAALFADLEGRWPLGDTLSVTAALGQAFLDPRAGVDYVYWQAGLSAEAFGLTFDLRYHGNNATICTTACADRVSFTLAKVF